MKDASNKKKVDESAKENRTPLILRETAVKDINESIDQLDRPNEYTTYNTIEEFLDSLQNRE